MEIKSEEFDIPEEDDDICNTINPFRNSIVTLLPKLVVMDNSEILGANEPKIYTPLKTVDYERVKTFGRTSSSPLITSPLKNIASDCISNNNNQSPRKLGAKVLGRRRSRRLISFKKSQTVVETISNSDNEIIEIDLELKKNMSVIDHEQDTTPVANFTQNICDNQDGNNCQSQEDMFEDYQDNNECNEIINDKNIENEYQEFTPLKAMKEKWKNTSVEDDKLFLSPQDDERRSISSDSEFERICSSIKNNKFNPSQFSFETMDLLDDFESIDDSLSNKLLLDMLKTPLCNGENINEPLTDPLATSPVKQIVPDDLDSLTIKGQPDKQKQLIKSTNEQTGKQKKSIKNTKRRTKCETELIAEENAMSTKVKFKKIKKKIKVVDKKSTISSTIMKKLASLNIKLEHEPSPQHQLETYISRPPSLIVKKLFIKYGPMKKGTYTESEDQKIIENWKRFCDINDWDPDDSNSFLQVRFNRQIIISNDEHIKFTQFLGYGLPWRSLYSVYQRFQLLFTKKRKRKFTKNEDEKILIYLDNETKYSQKCRQLAKLLCRSQVSIRNRYYLLKGQKKTRPEIEKNVEWDLPLIEKFLKLLIKLTLSNDVYDLKDAIIPKVVWKEIEKKLKISHDTMMRFWLGQLHLQLFYPRPLFENDIKIMLIEYMYVKGFSNKQDLIWHTIAQSFDGLTTYYLSRLFYSLVYNSPVKREKFAYIVGWLYEKRIPQLMEKSKDRYLPRLIYEEGKIRIRKDISPSSSSPTLSSPSSSPPPTISSSSYSPIFPSPND